MFPANFQYFRAGSVDEAVRLLGAHTDAKLLAGGHSLIPMMKLRLSQPGAVIDIGRIEALKVIEAKGDVLQLGALATHADVAASALVKQRWPLLAEVASKIADPQVRNRGTIAGNIAHADPASDWPAAILALDGQIQVAGPGQPRTVAASAFFLGLLETDLQPSEIITGIEVREPKGRTGSAYLKFEHPASGYAVCGAAASVTLGPDGKCTAARLCFNGVTTTPLDAQAVTSALVGSTLSDADIENAVDGRLSVTEPMEDVHFSGEYRTALAKIYGKRALKLARDRTK